jgi:hypothetical protein
MATTRRVWGSVELARAPRDDDEYDDATATRA